MACSLRSLGVVVFVLSLSLVVSHAAPSITIIEPSNATISNNTTDLNITISEPSNITYSWDGGGDISGCRNCTSFNTTYGETSDYTNASAVWHLNENFGSKIYDDSANSNNGSIFEAGWSAGRFGSALEFDGLNDFIEVPSSSSLDISKKITVGAWIKPKSWIPGSSHVIVEKAVTDDYLLFLADGRITFLVTTGFGVYYVEGLTALSAGQWYCVVGTYDGTTTEANLRVYLNGALDATGLGLGSISASAQSVKIGGNTSNDYFNGSIDEVIIYSRVLNDVEISNLCNKSLSEGSHNVTVHARNATGVLNSSTEYFRVDTIPPYRIDLHSPSNGSIVSSTAVFNWTSYDATSNMSSNLSVNGTMINASIPTNNSVPTTIVVSGLSEGLHNWSITSYDDAGNSNTSIIRYFTVDATPPKYLSYNITPLAPKDNESVTCHSFWNDSSDIDSVIVEENATGTNHTIAVNAPSGWGNYTIPPSDLEAGSVQCRFYANDTAGNLNATEPLIFTVGDTSPPLITNITYLPNTIDDLDPNVRINISANVTDFTTVDTVLLLYKQANESEWINTTMNRTSGSRYEGNFTPNTVNNWSFKIWANDSNNLINESDITNLSIDYDITWTRTPATFGVVSGGISTNITLGNLTITNTGDYDLNFSLSSSATHADLLISYNVSDANNISVPNGTSIVIRVNASLPVDEGQYSVVIIAQPNNASATPSSLDTNATVIAFTSGPFLYVTIDSYDPSVTQGDSGILLSASVTNKGNESESGVWLAWLLPSGWSNTSGVLNVSISGNLTVGAKRSNLITASVASSASTGAQTLSALSGSAQGKNGSASVTVTVSAAQAPAPVSTSGGGPGPAQTLRKVTPTYSPTPAEKETVLPTPKTLELVKGRNLTLTVPVSNTFPNTTLRNITLRITGYKPEYIQISPSSHLVIGYGTTEEFLVTIYAPPSENTIYPLTLDLNGSIVYLNYPTAFYEGTNAVATRENVSLALLETRNINLIVYDEIPPSFPPAPLVRETLPLRIDPMEVVRGSRSDLSLAVKNPFEGAELDSLTLKIEGYPNEYLTITPPSVDGLRHQETVVFQAVFDAPSFFRKETRNLKVVLNGVIHYHDYPAVVSEIDGRVLARRNYSLDLTEERSTYIVIHEVSRETALEALEKAGRAVESMQKEGLRVKRATRLLGNAKTLFAGGDYEGANQLAWTILDAQRFALDARDQLGQVGEDIRIAEDERWLKVIEAKNLYNLARAAYEREDYSTARERIEEARTTLALETKGKVNLAKAVLDNLVSIIIGAIAIAYLSVRIYRQAKIWRVSSKLNDLRAEEFGILRLIKETQTKFYKDKTIGHDTYHKTIKHYEDRLAEITTERTRLLAKKPVAVGVKELESLKKEEESLVKLLRDTQEAYFKDRAMSRREYESLAKQLHAERAALEGRIALAEASLEKRKRSAGLLVFSLLAMLLFYPPSVNGATDSDAQLSIAQAEEAILNMEEAGFSTEFPKANLREAKDALVAGDYDKAVEKSGIAISRMEKSFEIRDFLWVLEQNILEAESKQLDTSRAGEMMSAAVVAFDRENYDEAEEFISQASSELADIEAEYSILQARYNAARSNILAYTKEHAIGIIAFLFVLVLGGTILFIALSIVLTGRRIRDLELEKEVLKELIGKAQKEYYRDASISRSVYEIKTEKYTERMRNIEAELPVLNSKAAHLEKILPVKLGRAY